MNIVKDEENKIVKQKGECPICASDEIRKIIDWNEYSINECRLCRLIYSTPLPKDEVLTNFYQGFLFNLPDKRNIRKHVNKRKQELASLFKFVSEKKNFLDYGGGTGSAFKAACELNLIAYYHDLDKDAEKFVKKEYGLTNDFIIDDIKDTHVRFDYIFSDNVIEHLKNPVNYVKEMRNVLNQNGEIIIKTPHGRNTESFFYPLITLKVYFLGALKYNSTFNSIKSYFRRFWHCDPPRHLFSFTKSNLRIIALNAGFKESEIDIFYYKLPLFKYSLSEKFVNFRKHHSLKSFLLRIVVLPILPVEIISKILQIILLKLNIITPGGIILKLRKAHNNVYKK